MQLMVRGAYVRLPYRYAIASIAPSCLSLSLSLSLILAFLTTPYPYNRCDVQMSGIKGVTAFPKGDNLNKWTATITGAEGTVYAGLKYKLDMSFPAEYPYSAPTVKFVTACFHPNVDTHGNICLDILKDKWSAAYSVQTVLVSLQSLLGEPNVDSPLNNQAADLWANQTEYKRVLLAKYEKESTV